MLKKLIVTVMSAILILGMFMGIATAASQKVIYPTIFINGVKYVPSSSDLKPYVNNENRIIVPVAFVVSGLGVSSKSVTYDSLRKMVSIKFNSKLIDIPLNQKKIAVNGEFIPTDVAAFQKDGRAHLSLKYLAIAMGINLKSENGNIIKLTGNGIKFTPGSTSGTTGPTTPVSINNNNLSKYGFTKVAKFPLTVESNDFSYTLKKMYLYPIDSKEANDLKKLYGLRGNDSYEPKYVLYTEFDLVNKSKKSIGRNSKSPDDKFQFILSSNGDGSNPVSLFPKDSIVEVENNPVYLWSWNLDPGKKLSGKHAYYIFDKDLDSIRVFTQVFGNFVVVDLASKE